MPEVPQLGKASDRSWANEVGAWIETLGLMAPSKVAVANWLIENDKAVPSVEGVQQLKSLHKDVTKSLGL